MNKYQFGRQLKIARKKDFNKTISEMAEMVGIAESQLRNYEHGTVGKPSRDTMSKLSRTYNIPYQEVQTVYYPDENKLKKIDSKARSLFKYRTKGESEHILDPVALGKRLKQKRETVLKKSLSELGSQFGLNKGHLSQIERGKIDEPSIDTLGKIALAYGVNFKELSNVFFKDEETAQKAVQMDIILTQIASDEKYKLGDLMRGALEENMGEKTKLLIIRLYEKLHSGKKLI